MSEQCQYDHSSGCLLPMVFALTLWTFIGQCDMDHKLNRLQESVEETTQAVKSIEGE